MSKRSMLLAVAVGTCFTLGAEAPDRVGFPARYAAEFELLRTVGVKDRQQVGAVYANKAAADVTRTALPYPDGAVFLMEWRAALKDASGQLLPGKDGGLLAGDVVRLDVMRRERGFGEEYGDDRAGDWAFASYGPSGGLITSAADALACARCHKKAGAAKDFVYRGRFPQADGQ